MSVGKTNQRIHPVETQWHYRIMIAHGYTAETKTAIGPVRHYVYIHPSKPNITCSTGVGGDYWNEDGTGKYGYWWTLKPFLTSQL
jgi:hypothetical protein